MERKRITRELLRSMTNGMSVTVNCADQYDLDSQRNTAYAFGKYEGCKFTCIPNGLELTVTRYDSN